MQHLDLIGFFTLGFFGGFGHCIGMCHPFVLYISGRFSKDKKGYSGLIAPHLWYNTGRIVTYSILGAVAGFLGDIADMAGNLVGIQKTAAIIAGAFLVLYALFSLAGYNLITKLENRLPVDKIMGLVKLIQPGQPVTTGLLFGLLPCGLLYSALIASASSARAAKGALSMAIFGLGTVPAIMITAVFGNILMRRRGIFNILGSILLLGMGIYFILSGIQY